MEEKMLDLMEKMYIKMTNIEEIVLQNREGIEKNREAIEVNREGIEKNREAIEVNRQGIERNRVAIELNRHAITKLENKMDQHLTALYDGYRQNTESLLRIEKKIDGMNEKLQKQEVDIRVLKAAK